MNDQRLFLAAAFAASCLASVASAQSPSLIVKGPSGDPGVGTGVTINGNVNSGALGTVNRQAMVILPASHAKVHGVGLLFPFGGGCILNEVTEIRGVFTYQPWGRELASPADHDMHAEFDPYRTLGLDSCLRRHFGSARNVRADADGLVGAGFIVEIDTR